MTVNLRQGNEGKQLAQGCNVVMSGVTARNGSWTRHVFVLYSSLGECPNPYTTTPLSLLFETPRIIVQYNTPESPLPSKYHKPQLNAAGIVYHTWKDGRLGGHNHTRNWSTVCMRQQHVHHSNTWHTSRLVRVCHNYLDYVVVGVSSRCTWWR